MDVTTALPAGLRWEADRGRLRVRDPELADTVLRDPHIITGVDRSRAGMARHMPAEDETPTIAGFFELWYTVGDHYSPFNTELRRVFTARVVDEFTESFENIANRLVANLPERGDLARDYFSPYYMHSTFHLIGVPAREWPNLTKVAKLVIHLFKQQLLGRTEYDRRETTAFATVMRYLKKLTDDLLAGPGDVPFLRAARALHALQPGSWPIAALIGQLLMAGIEPMIVGSSIAARTLWQDPDRLATVRRGTVGMAEVVEEVLRQNPPFGNIFRFVSEPCDCLGVPLPVGTIVAIDIAAVNLAGAPTVDPAHGCPVRHNAVLTFGRGTHYCLGANSARGQVAIGMAALVAGRPDLRIDQDAVRIDTHNNLKEVRALPYSLGRKETP